MWNDTEAPIAYLITFRTYGTWLHGDARGSVNRFRNEFGTSLLPKQMDWIETNHARMKREQVKLNIDQRKSVGAAVRDTCSIRKWLLYAENVRSNHVHSVVSAGGRKPGIYLNALKANATRALRENGLYWSESSPWSDKGSTRWLWTEGHLSAAIDYVLYSQGDDFFALD